jgi:hypothetical protein
MTRIVLNVGEDRNIYKYAIQFDGGSGYTLNSSIGEVETINNCINIGNAIYMRMRTVYNDAFIENSVRATVEQGVGYSEQFRCITRVIRSIEQQWGTTVVDMIH